MHYKTSIRRACRFLRTGSAKSRDYTRYFQRLREGRGRHEAGILNVTIDLELAWSRARGSSGSTKLADSLERARLTRTVFSEFLALSDSYEIPITFAIVAHLALADCSGHRKAPPFTPYWLGTDWFAIDPRSSLASNPEYYGMDLVRAILNSGQDHEIASHGFSHVDLSDDATTAEVALFEISESFDILRRLDSRLTTLVFPNNRPGFVEILKRVGFAVYRSGEGCDVKRDEFGLWRFPVGLWLSPLACTPHEVAQLVALGVEKKHVVALWCHLYEFKSAQMLRAFLEPVFEFVGRYRRAGLLEVATVRDIVDRVTSMGCANYGSAREPGKVLRADCDEGPCLETRR
ncbi:MAG: hypothetical protein ACREQA_22315 [Candidatus Binatia bacterium]